ncbi:nucleotide exchange factor GrpE [Allocoleopsis franciscana]|uniref:Protein GrpE n=1 Tax=Allocoleopsis franciscana PCC 7113 TaxID=1173027 RepID=K9W963_9CYAN|nr:nucleotide exchange factor GrpE [Allocoleopsis franciscana]AFZ16768.1 molecular chaperone GrpE (heat shock protein) [Allocoleopsis franciscana PCC 7113]
MIDEENQPDSTSQPTNEAADSQSVSDQQAVVAEGGLVDLEYPSAVEEETAESTAVSAKTEGEAQEATQAAADLPLAGGELEAILKLRQENDALKAQLEELNQQSESFKTQSMRIAADFDNFRKRTTKEKEDLEQQIKRVTLSELLPVVDNFERARSQIKPQDDGEMGIHKSYQGVYKQLVDCLKRIGVSAMRPEGKEFDPNLHEAVMREATNEYPEGVVIEQLVRGYFLGERVLRHAMVKVASAPETPSEESDESQASSPE